MTKYSRYKDYTIRQSLNKSQFQKYILKFFFSSENLSKFNKFKIMLKRQRSTNALLSTKYINRCIFSNKIRAVSRLTNLTKSSFKSNLAWGKVTGFKKASW